MLNINPIDLQRKILDAILDGDRSSAGKILSEFTKTHGYKETLINLLEPALLEFGKIWSKKEDVSLAQGYIAGKIAEDFMTRAIKDISTKPSATALKGPVVIGNIEDDYHALGRKMVTTFLRASGWKVYDLGNDCLPADLVDKAQEVGAKIIGVSAMMYTTVQNIKKLRAEIDNRKLTNRIQLAVGGAVFLLRPELVMNVGGDGTSRNAINAPQLMEKLWKKAVTAEKRN